MVKSALRKFASKLASGLGLKSGIKTPALTPKRVEARIYPPVLSSYPPGLAKRVVRVSFIEGEEKFFVTIK